MAIVTVSVTYIFLKVNMNDILLRFGLNIMAGSEKKNFVLARYL